MLKGVPRLVSIGLLKMSFDFDNIVVQLLLIFLAVVFCFRISFLCLFEFGVIISLDTLHQLQVLPQFCFWFGSDHLLGLPYWFFNGDCSFK
jgi:hypothetical protein